MYDMDKRQPRKPRTYILTVRLGVDERRQLIALGRFGKFQELASETIRRLIREQTNREPLR